MTQITRRGFLKRSALTGVVSTGFWSQRAPGAPKSPNEKLNIGCIGVGNQGHSDPAQRRMVELILAGALGEVHAWTNRPSRAPRGDGSFQLSGCFVTADYGHSL